MAVPWLIVVLTVAVVSSARHSYPSTRMAGHSKSDVELLTLSTTKTTDTGTTPVASQALPLHAHTTVRLPESHMEATSLRAQWQQSRRSSRGGDSTRFEVDVSSRATRRGLDARPSRLFGCNLPHYLPGVGHALSGYSDASANHTDAFAFASALRGAGCRVLRFPGGTPAQTYVFFGAHKPSVLER